MGSPALSPRSRPGRRPLVRYSGGFGRAVFGQALRDVGGPIPRQDLGFVRLVSAFVLPDLLGSAFFRSFAIFGGDSFRIDQLLSKGRFTNNQCSDDAQVPK
jgi:hypothetical protein